jgi:hypothetical protein
MGQHQPADNAAQSVTRTTNVRCEMLMHGNFIESILPLGIG